uniref:Uncharacterized protein n=1 Tax=Pyrodinium bahamense TaxID=73915 RepID=A0A7S0AK62_9DINO|mmetsp:Transcript_36058/g.100042  ORF Transcript_36058/g.100042 Transcript_36058/m.100042 type:complete len:302 (+) Transcript_36058:87-992(+)
MVRAMAHLVLATAFSGTAGLTFQLAVGGDSAKSQLSAQEPGKSWPDHVMEQMEAKWAAGFFAHGAPSGTAPVCGQSTFQELQTNIPKWKEDHPHVRDPFCHFQNHAFWFAGQGSVGEDYRSFGMYSGVRLEWTSTFCDSTAETSMAGPEMALHYDGGNITWTHARSFIDIVDDPYCYSLGWLKGQNLDGALMSNRTAWEEVARRECEMIQEEYRFDDEEVTVGRHIFTTPVYFKQTWNSLKGAGPPITKRLHKEHVYTKCQLGDGAPAEMAYCYYKGCVLPGNRIGHSTECGYDLSGMAYD